MGAGCLVQDSYTLKGKDLLYVIPIGDVHRGNPSCNYEFLDYWEKMVSKIKNPKIFIYMGDLIEVGSKHVGNSIAVQDLSADDQIIQTSEFIREREDESAVILAGNHKKRLEREFDLKVVRLLSYMTGVPYANQYRQEFKINDESFVISASHGVGSNKYAHLAQGKIIRDTNQIRAKLFLEGHNHRMDFFPLPVLDPSKYKGFMRQYYGFTGSFLNYSGYPDNMNLPPLPPAFQFITIDKHLNVRNIPYYIDQRLPEAMEDFNELALMKVEV